MLKTVNDFRACLVICTKTSHKVTIKWKKKEEKNIWMKLAEKTQYNTQLTHTETDTSPVIIWRYKKKTPIKSRYEKPATTHTHTTRCGSGNFRALFVFIFPFARSTHKYSLVKMHFNKTLPRSLLLYIT